MSFLTNVMVTNPFPMLILQSEVYLTLSALIVRKMVYGSDVNDIVEVLPHQLLFCDLHCVQSINQSIFIF